MIFAAHKSGADMIKLQIIDHNDSYEKGTVSYQLFKKTQMSKEEIFNIYKICRRNKIKVFSTFDKKNFEFFKNLNQDCYKISSSLFYDFYFIKKILATRKPLIISSGLSDLEDIDVLLKLLKYNTNKKIALLHCRSLYPTVFNKLNLARINFLKNKYNMIVGFSDHSLGINASVASIHHGAKIIEKHFTLDSKKPSFDHKISLEPKQFKRMVNEIRVNESMIGSPDFKVFDKTEDFKKMKIFIRGFKLNTNIKKDKILKSSDFSLVRSKQPKNITKFSKIINFVLKKKIKKPLKKGSYLRLNDFQK